ncbi:unnamed protein product [Nippostrongylus brasiliensis]|uniref:Transposase n=1 Tax=Nippostrongylus brasiliensis TaxID=27835 RepID=A0A0N4YKF7_NIPBR|nr:unnamed protein product [Nippostrongylus brasiliensis]
MVAPSPKRGAIIMLHHAGMAVVKISKRLNVNRSVVWRTIKRFEELGTMADRPRSRHPVTARTDSNRRNMRAAIRRNPRVSIRKLAKTANIATMSAWRLFKLNLRSYRCQKAHTLTPKMMQIRVERCKRLLRRFSAARHLNIVFSDEKLFTIEQSLNRQNNRIIGSSILGSITPGRTKLRNLQLDLHLQPTAE